MNEEENEIIEESDEDIIDNNSEEVVDSLDDLDDEIESEDEVPSSDYSDYEEDYSNNEQLRNQLNQQAQNKLRDYIKNRKDKNTVDKLNQRKVNTLSKRRTQTTNEVAKTGAEEAGKSVAETGAKTGAIAGKTAAGSAATGAATTGAGATAAAAGTAEASGFAALAANPYFWIVVGIIAAVIILIILVIVLYVAYDGSNDENNNNNSGQMAYVEGYEECTSITVSGKGTYSLEEYVAGVVTAEHGSAPAEAKKALAVAARTYAIMGTGKCSIPIEASSRKQNFTPNYTDAAMEAATATAGQVLTYDGSLFSSEYDSWYCKGSSTCTYTREPDNSTHTVTLSSNYLKQAAGGHGRGMSQLAAADMADQGKTYDEILKYFYSDGVEIASIVETAGSTDASASYDIPTSIDDLKNRYWFTYDMDYYASLEGPTSHLFGQCVWYAKHRAMDIINSSSLSQSEKDSRIEAIKNVGGNGQDIVPNLSGSIFNKTNDIDSIKAPAIVSWRHSTYGHVGIIEKISTDSSGNKTYYITDGGRKKNSAGAWYTVSRSNLWSVVKFFQEPSASRSTVSSRWSGYMFNGAASLTE